MKKTSLTLSILLIVFGCASLPPETQIVNFFNQKQADPEILSDPSIARWVASGNLNGTIYYDYPNGIRYFADVPIDKNKALLLFQELTLRGDNLSQAILGIIYRRGQIVQQDLNKSLELLSPVKDVYSDAAGEFGLALHQMLRDDLVETEKREDVIEKMFFSLEFARRNNYIPALNALSQLYREGRFVLKDISKSASYSDSSKILIDRKLALAKNISESRMLASQYSLESSEEAKKFDRLTLIIGLGVIGAVSFYTYQPSAPAPGYFELLNWGMLE